MCIRPSGMVVYYKSEMVQVKTVVRIDNQHRKHKNSGDQIQKMFDSLMPVSFVHCKSSDTPLHSLSVVFLNTCFEGENTQGEA